MINTLQINGVAATVTYDPNLEMFRGEFLGLNGGADFYAADIDGLKREGETSLKVFLEACEEDGAEPFLDFSGKFMVRTQPDIHALAVAAAKASGLSLNQWVSRAIEKSADAERGFAMYIAKS